MRYLLTILICFILAPQLYAQDLAGRRIINGSFNFSHVNTHQSLYSANSNLNTSVLIGKIASDNTYWAFGGKLSIIEAENRFRNYAFFMGPAVERGKFISLVDKLYLAPYFGGNLNAVFGNDSGVDFGVYASPLRFAYLLKDRFFLTAGFGSASARATFMGYYTNVNINASLTNNSSFGVFYTFK
jgi:hypothetical protein